MIITSYSLKLCLSPRVKQEKAAHVMNYRNERNRVKFMPVVTIIVLISFFLFIATSSASNRSSIIESQLHHEEGKPGRMKMIFIA